MEHCKWRGQKRRELSCCGEHRTQDLDGHYLVPLRMHLAQILTQSIWLQHTYFGLVLAEMKRCALDGA